MAGTPKGTPQRLLESQRLFRKLVPSMIPRKSNETGQLGRPNQQRPSFVRSLTGRRRGETWSFLVAITVAAAIGCCSAATMMQTKSNTTQPKPDLALTTATLEALPMRMQNSRKAAAMQAIRTSIGKQLQQL